MMTEVEFGCLPPCCTTELYCSSSVAPDPQAGTAAGVRLTMLSLYAFGGRACGSELSASHFQHLIMCPWMLAGHLMHGSLTLWSKLAHFHFRMQSGCNTVQGSSLLQETSCKSATTWGAIRAHRWLQAHPLQSWCRPGSGQGP